MICDYTLLEICEMIDLRMSFVRESDLVKSEMIAEKMNAKMLR